MVYGLAKAYEASDNKENFMPERKTHKKRPGGHPSLLPMLSRLSRRTPAKA